LEAVLDATLEVVTGPARRREGREGLKEVGERFDATLSLERPDGEVVAEGAVWVRRV
jgi:hypothetical protein